MNKEVIYLEPEDDITDILTKLQQAEQKLVALVPPKKGTMLRSAVNMKLVARVAKECEKVVVIVTADPAIVKMAMAARIPVAKTLQSRPVVPTEEQIKAAEANEQVIEEELEEDVRDAKNAKKMHSTNDKAAQTKTESALELTEDSFEQSEKDKKKSQQQKKAAKESNNNNSFIQKYRKLIMIGSAAAVVLVIVLVWAFVFAPAVKITVAISSTPNNFSESVRFTADQAAQNLEENLFYAQQITLDKTYKTDITATGEEDRGEKATGTLSVVFQFRLQEYKTGFIAGVTEGDVFTTTDGLQYRATETLDPVKWDGDSFPVICDTSVNSLSGTCIKTFTVAVEAMNGGSDYNLPARSSWKRFEEKATVSNPVSISGGTTKMVRVISAEDIAKIKDVTLADHSEDGKDDLMEDLSKDLIPIEASFKSEVTEVITTPTQNEEIKPDDTPSAEVKITYSIYAINKQAIEQYIDDKTQVAADQKIYDYGQPYFERFSGIENDARLKSTVETGPTVTEEDILEKVKGMKTGQVAAALRSINGISSVNIETSYFWVWSVPTDPSRITINMEVEDKQ